MSHSIEVKPANSSLLLKQVFEIRRKVFVEEQQVDPKEEYDEYETSSTQLVAIYNGLSVGTCRYRNTEKGIKLERFAVLQDYRGLGVGEALVKACLEQVDKRRRIYLHAQVQVVDFYGKFGFKKTGPRFREAGIEHYLMFFKTTLP